jgi:hypothetical protein
MLVLSMSFLRLCLRASQTDETPFGKFVHAAVQNFGFVTSEWFAFGKQLTEVFACNDELLYLFLDRHDTFLPVRGTPGEIIWMRLKSGCLFASPRIFQFLPEACHRLSRRCSHQFE